VNILSVFSFAKGEQYGVTIGQEMKRGKSLEDAIRIAYKEHGIIPVSKIPSSILFPSVFLSAMGGVVGGYYGQNIGFFNQKLKSALLKVSQEMINAGES